MGRYLHPLLVLLCYTEKFLTHKALLSLTVQLPGSMLFENMLAYKTHLSRPCLLQRNVAHSLFLPTNLFVFARELPRSSLGGFSPAVATQRIPSSPDSMSRRTTTSAAEEGEGAVCSLSSLSQKPIANPASWQRRPGRS